MTQDLFKITGHVKMVLKDAEGKTKQEFEGKNLVTTAGKNLIADLVAQDSDSAPSHIAIGTSSTAAAVDQTALIGTELARGAADTTVTDNQISLSEEFAAGTGTGTIEEAGIFNAASSGTMLARFLTGTFAKGASDSLTITWTLTIGS